MKIIITIFTIFFFTNIAKAEDFDSYVNKLKEHPAIESVLENSKKYKNLASSEMGLPDPQLIVGVDNVPVSDPSFNQFLPTAKVYGFRQQIPRYSLRKAKSNKQLVLSKKQRLIADYSLNRLKAYFISSLYEYDKVRKLEDILKKQISYYKELENHLRGRLESGKSVYGRLSEIDVERTEIEQKLNNLQVEKTEIQEEFINLVGEIPNLPLPKIKNAKLPNNIENIYPILISKKDIESARQSVKAAEAGFGPNYGVQALYKDREAGANFAGDDWFSVQATVSIPLWYYWNQKPKLQAASHERSQAVYSYDNIKRSWTKRMRSLASERNYTKDNISLLEGQKKSMNKIISAAKRSYESGSSHLESVLDARIDKLTIESHLATSYSKHAKLSAEFNSHLIMENEYE
ncbi:TolC family protein [Rickettsiales bacterium]|nr:TolC family protein [Rickettsiales bacterium]